jgi:hypothetical protein
MGIDAQMLVVCKKGQVSPEQLRTLSWKMCGAFGHQMFWLHYKTRSALSFTKEFIQDGDSIFSDSTEDLIEVSLYGRYYGKGYERGPIEFYVILAEWFEYNIPGCSVLYGGDSSGVCATSFNAIQRRKVMEHFYSVGHQPYRGGFSSPSGHLCSYCNQVADECGWGQGCILYSCQGCGTQYVRKGDRAIELFTDEQKQNWSTILK